MPIEIWVAVIGGLAAIIAAVIGIVDKKSSNSRTINIKQKANGDGNKQSVNVVNEGDVKDE